MVMRPTFFNLTLSGVDMKRGRKPKITVLNTTLVKAKRAFKEIQHQLITDEAIGEMYGITRQAVYASRKRLGIPASDKYTKRNAMIIAKYVRGVSVVHIAQSEGISISQVYRIVRKNKTAKTND